MRASDGKRARKVDWFNWDGSVNLQSNWRSSAVVVDDFGDLLRVHRCAVCRHWLPADEEHFQAVQRHSDGRVKRWLSWCKPCALVRRREQKRSLSKAVRSAANRKQYERTKADPERARRRLEANRRAQRRWRQTSGYKEAQKRYREGVRQDPKRHKAHQEAERMRYRLRRERRGLKVLEPLMDRTSGNGPVVPMLPLLAVVIAYVERYGIEEDAFEERVGVSIRTLRDWRGGLRQATRAETADRVLSRLGYNWWDVYEKPTNGHERGRAQDVLKYIAEAEVYVQACLAFEGELVE